MLPIKLVGCTTLALMLGGCGTLRPGSVQAGECKVFQAPLNVVSGKTNVDQYWIDDTVESGVAACGWPRPKLPKKAKPAPKPKPKAKQPTAPPPPVVVPAPEPPPVVVPPPVPVEKPLPWYTRTWIWVRDHFWSVPW